MNHYKPLSIIFPSYHIQKGQPTFFVEKLWMSLIQCGAISISKCAELSKQTGIGNLDIYKIRKCELHPKVHTIREGCRVKAGDTITFYVWSGKPYRSKWIVVSPKIEVKQVWNFTMNQISRPTFKINGHAIADITLPILAQNDGLTLNELTDWLCMPKSALEYGFFAGQIICWHSEIKY